MKKISTLIILAVAGLLNAGSATVTITNNGLTFSPDNVVVNSGDVINFVLASIHNAVQVDQATWDANGNTPMAGGFSIPFGGGSVTLTLPGTYYYVCQPHASVGMKGTIVVQPSTLVQDVSPGALNSVNVYPNPASNYINVEFKLQQNENVTMDLIDITGRSVARFINNKVEGDFSGSFNLPDLSNGKYFLRFQAGTQVIIKSILIKK